MIDVNVPAPRVHSEVLDGHGAVWVTPREHGISTSFGLRSTQEVEDEVQKMWTAIANGDVNAWSSYVTRWNHELKRAELVAGTWCQDGKYSVTSRLTWQSFRLKWSARRRNRAGRE